MKSLAHAIERTGRGLLASAVLLTVLFFWHRQYASSCLALLVLAPIFAAVFAGLLEHRLERRRFAVEYYLTPESRLRRLFSGLMLPTATSCLLAVPLTAALALFAALSRPTDWYFLGALAVAAPICGTLVGVWPGSHIRRAAKRRVTTRDILSTRISGWLLFAAGAATYAYANYELIAVPAGIAPGSLDATVINFKEAVSSGCAHIEAAVSLAAHADAISWWLMVAGPRSGVLNDNLIPILWIVFFMKTAMVFGAFMQALNGAILLACRTSSGRRHPGAAETAGPAARRQHDPAYGKTPEHRGDTAAADMRPMRRGFIWTIVALIAATLSLIVSGAMRPIFAGADNTPHAVPAGPTTTEARPLEAIDPCFAAIQFQELPAGVFHQLGMHLAQAAYPESMRKMETAIERAFKPAYERLGPLLDRHYSVIGQYEELLALAAGETGMQAVENLFEGLEDRLNTAFTEIEDTIRGETRRIAVEQPPPESVAPECGAATAYRAVWNDITADSADRFMRLTLPAGGVAGLTGAVAAKTAVTTLSKAFGKKILVLIGTKTGVKWLAKMLGSMTIGAGAGSLLGPLGTAGGALVGAVTGLAAWLSVDAAAVEIDEHLNRADLERELRALIDEEKHALIDSIQTSFDESRKEAGREIEQRTPAELFRESRQAT